VSKQLTSKQNFEMEKSEFRVLIKYYSLCGKTVSETKFKHEKYYLGSSPPYGMVQMWFTVFRCGRTCTETHPSPGCPNEIMTPEMINKIHDMVLDNKKLKEHEISKTVVISNERVYNILHKYLQIRNLCARCVL